MGKYYPDKPNTFSGIPMLKDVAVFAFRGDNPVLQVILSLSCFRNFCFKSFFNNPVNL